MPSSEHRSRSVDGAGRDGVASEGIAQGLIEATTAEISESLIRPPLDHAN